MSGKENSIGSSGPITKKDLMIEVCHACGGRMPHCDTDVIEACYRWYIKQHPQIVIVARVSAPANPAGQQALARYSEVIDGMHKVPKKEGESR